MLGLGLGLRVRKHACPDGPTLSLNRASFSCRAQTTCRPCQFLNSFWHPACQQARRGASPSSWMQGPSPKPQRKSSLVPGTPTSPQMAQRASSSADCDRSASVTTPREPDGAAARRSRRGSTSPCDAHRSRASRWRRPLSGMPAAGMGVMGAAAPLLAAGAAAAAGVAAGSYSTRATIEASIRTRSNIDASI